MLLARFFIVFLITICINISESKAEPTPIETAWLDEMETFPVWYAHKEKLDIKEGILLKLNSYSTGRILIDSFSSKKWKIGASGLIPALHGIINKDIAIIAMGVDETDANIIVGRKNTPILQSSADKNNVIGSLLLCPYGTNSHRLLLKWLETLNVNESLVNIQDMPPNKAVESFIKGFGDAVSFWLPSASQFYPHESLVKLTDARQCNISFNTVILADKEYIKTNPKEVQSFITIYLEAINKINAMNEKERIKLYKDFKLQYGHTTITDQQAQLELQNHSFYNLEQQQALFVKDNPTSIYNIVKEHLPFIEKYFAIDRRDKVFLENYTYITDTFIKR